MNWKLTVTTDYTDRNGKRARQLYVYGELTRGRRKDAIEVIQGSYITDVVIKTWIEHHEKRITGGEFLQKWKQKGKVVPGQPNPAACAW